MPAPGALELCSFPFKAMGSPCELKFYCQSRAAAEQIAGRLIAEVDRLEAKYTRYKPDSVTSAINASAGTDSFVSVDLETSRLLDYAQSLFEQSDGLFDITSGVLRRVWDFRSNQLPSEEALDSVLPLIGWPMVERKADAVRLPVSGMEVDFGGYVKEYTADVIATRCIDEGIQHGLVNFGGDVRIIGPHPDGAAWRVGIQHPRQTDKVIAVVEIAQGGIATSGDYERYMIVDGTRYSHLLNPTNGQSLQPRMASASVIADSCLIAGSFSTLAMLKSPSDSRWLETVGLPFLLIDHDMRLHGSIGSAAE